jgi:RNA-directed DNA polymerase
MSTTHFVGQILKPHRRILRRRTFNDALRRIEEMDAGDVFESANSYFGLARQATHSRRDRQYIAKAVMRRGHAVNYELTKTYRRHG